jgi:hypothetical protein
MERQMRMNKSGLAIGVALLLLAGCKQPAADAAATDGAAAAVDAAAGDAADAPASATPPTISKNDAISMGVAMTAAVELCGLSNAIESQAALAKMAAEPGAPSAGEMEAIYLAAKQQGKAAQAQNPGKFEQECAGLRKMADPAEVKKMEQAAKELEAWADKMEAEAKAK